MYCKKFDQKKLSLFMVEIRNTAACQCLPQIFSDLRVGKALDTPGKAYKNLAVNAIIESDSEMVVS